MAKKVSERKRNFLKGITKLNAVFLIFVSIAFLTVSIIGVVEAIPFFEGITRSYTLSYYNYDNKLLLTERYYRGTEIDYTHAPTPKKIGNTSVCYRFIGWDWSGDGYADDVLPEKAYSNYTFVAVFEEVNLRW